MDTCSNRCALKDYNLNKKRSTVSVDILLAFSCVLGKKNTDSSQDGYLLANTR